MITVFIRAIILYALLIFAVRLMGKRQIGELQPSELAITILVSNLATLPIEEPGEPLLKGILPILTLCALDVLLSLLSGKFRGFRSLMSGNPVVIIRDGVIDVRAMKELRFTTDDLVQSLRIQGIFDISEVQFAVVETTGNVSAYPKFPNRNTTNADMKISGENSNPPQLIIDNGKLVRQGLDEIKMTENALNTVLSKEDVTVDEIFMMTAESQSKYTIIKRG
ncbi:MAG: DUF421 domain-containing protein [Ruminococcus sp.]|jgi:uncharacterized membrane protein YcaP (DUF421 family)|nr:DUF421 domain-containing protein [Ruminococcus sp.]